VRQIAEHVGRNSARAAGKLTNRLFQAARRLEAQPAVGWEVPELGRTDYREILARPYRIVYRTAGDTCYIVAVIHGSRDLTQRLDPDAPESGE
jgi:toxin ParE1/3/4